MINSLRASSPSAAPARPSFQPAPNSQPTGDVEFSYNAQDSMVMPPGTTIIHGVKEGPEVDQAKLVHKLKPADGKYVYPQSDARYHYAATLATVAKTIEMFSGAAGKFDWAFGDKQLNIKPDHGQDFNAYYSRDDGSVNFFHGKDPVTSKMVFSGDSGEVVSHETGHAMLDSFRPGYFSTFSPDPAAFHESFGDCIALFASLQDDRTLDKVVEQTGGDLSKTNAASELGEELGTAINDAVGHDVTGGNYTRNAINNFKWADPSTLPDSGGPDELGSEAHSFSRLWTGATYDLIKGITDQNLQAGQAPKEAIRNAGADGLKLYGALMKTAPQGDFAYRDMAVALVQADQQANKGKYSDLITKVFKDRLILPESFNVNEVPARPATIDGPKVRTLKVKLDGPEYGKFSGATVENAVGGDSPLSKDAEDRIRVQNNLKKLISAGKILYTEPNQVVKPRDLFDKNGQPYMGVVRWTDGQMKIERVKIAS